MADWAEVFHDARGYFMEAFKEEEFRAHVGNVHFIQDNESKSSFGVLRGLHYQKGDCSQANWYVSLRESAGRGCRLKENLLPLSESMSVWS